MAFPTLFRTLLSGVVALVTACGPDDSPNSESTSSPELREIRTPTGAILHIAKPPTRVLPLNAAAFELARELIGPESFAALPATIDDYAAGHELAQWAALPRFERLEGEQLLDFDPDFVITHTWQSSASLNVLRRLGVPIFEIPNVHDFDVVLDSLRALGEVFQQEERAARLIAQLEQRRQAVHDPARAALRAMTYGNFGTGGWTAGRHTTADLVLRMTGLRNAAAEAGLEGHCRLEIERLLDLDPDLLIVAAADGDDDWAPTLRTLRETPELRHLQALQKNHIVEIPTHLYGTTSHTLMDFAEALAEAVDSLD